MKVFTSITEAFEWWLQTVYPALSAEEKGRNKNKYRNAWRDYTFKKGISESRMKEILSDFGVVDVRTIVTFNPK